MIGSVAAGTCAVTFLVDPYIENRSTNPVVYDTTQPKVCEVLDDRVSSPNIQIPDSAIAITDIDLPSWYPSEGEQQVMRRALLRSAKVVSHGQRVR